MKIIPVYDKEKTPIPILFNPTLNVKFNKKDFKGFIKNLYAQILR